MTTFICKNTKDITKLKVRPLCKDDLRQMKCDSLPFPLVVSMDDNTSAEDLTNYVDQHVCQGEDKRLSLEAIEEVDFVVCFMCNPEGRFGGICEEYKRYCIYKL